MTDIRKQFYKLKELLGDENNLQLSNEDALRYQDALTLLERRGYLINVSTLSGTEYCKKADLKGFEEWLDEEYPPENSVSPFEVSDSYQQLKKLIKDGKRYDQIGNGSIEPLPGENVRDLIDGWINDVDIFTQRYMANHPLHTRIHNTIFMRPKETQHKLLSLLESAERDQSFVAELAGSPIAVVPKYQEYQAKTLPEYDVFISHANKDKEEFVDELNESLKKLDINIFYDKESLEWGDNWKDRILNGVKKAEFAIIVISENFFDREWTEKELSEFLSRQNRNSQKIILPILHNISAAQLQEKYPSVADIQAIDSSKCSCDTIALKFAGQLIKRLKNT